MLTCGRVATVAGALVLALSAAAGCGSGEHFTAQDDYEIGWETGQSDACEWVMSESPDGVLYVGDQSYDETDCEISSEPPGDWPGTSDYPMADGEADGWEAMCETFFVVTVGSDALYWGDDVTVDRYECEAAGP